MSKQAAAELAVSPVDVDGRELRLSTSPTDHVAVAALVVQLDGSLGRAEVHLEVLAASHRVRLVESGALTVTETVACGDAASASAQLPTDHAWNAGEHTMAFSSEIVDGDAAVAAAVDTIAGLDADRSIVARFPGHSMAYTAIELLPARPAHVAAWRTWHLYPGPDPHVVFTSTTVMSASMSPSVQMPSLQMPSLQMQGVS